jgi:hypothetical protein
MILCLRRPLHLASLGAFIIAVALLSRSYEGIRHDGTLYWGQLLLRQGVHQLAADPFFLGGSQDSYSLFSLLLGPLIATLPSAWTVPCIVLASLGCSALAVLTLLHRMLGGKRFVAALGLLAVMCVSPLYGGLHMFGYTEPFLTARTLAEPLLLWSLVPLAGGRLMRAALLQLAALAFHPLMALPALVVTWLMACTRNPRWLLLLAVPLLALASAATRQVPWSHRLLGTFDPYWWALVSQANAQVVLGNWRLADWATIAIDAGLIASVTLKLPRAAPRQMLGSLLLAMAGLMTSALVATDVLHWVLPTQLQLWRVLWLVHLLAVGLAPWLVWQLWIQGGLSRIASALVVLALACNHVGSASGAAVLAAWLLCEWAAARRLAASTGLVRWVVTACLLAAIGLGAANLALEIERLHWHPTPALTASMATRVFAEPVIAFPLVLGLAALSARTVLTAATVAVSSLALLVFAAWHWDQRDTLSRAIESTPTARPFQAQIPINASVFWPDHLQATWGLLHRISHYERQQGAGMLFHRATAEIIGPRRDAYRRIREEKESCEAGVWMSSGTAQDLAACQTPSNERLRELCSGRERPDFLVFGTPAARPLRAVATWEIGEQRLHLYRCSQFAGTGADGQRAE